MEARQPYRIERGSFTRQEGGEFKYYSAKVTGDAGAKDLIDLTDAEARAFGLHRLTRLTRRNIQTEVITPNTSGGSDLVDTEMITALIEAGEAANGAQAARAWREQVIASGALEDVPSKKSDILEALKALAE